MIQRHSQIIQRLRVRFYRHRVLYLRNRQLLVHGPRIDCQHLSSRRNVQLLVDVPVSRVVLVLGPDLCQPLIQVCRVLTRRLHLELARRLHF